MKLYTALALAAMLAAVFVFAPQSFADCPPGTPDCPQPTPVCPADKPACWILPPQSIEVNAGGVSAGPGGSGGGGGQRDHLWHLESAARVDGRGERRIAVGGLFRAPSRGGWRGFG